MTDENGREFKNIVSIVQTDPARLQECKLECGHIAFGSQPHVGGQLRCKRCERRSDRVDIVVGQGRRADRRVAA